MALLAGSGFVLLGVMGVIWHCMLGSYFISKCKYT